jgi:hypothetical protein
MNRLLKAAFTTALINRLKLTRTKSTYSLKRHHKLHNVQDTKETHVNCTKLNNNETEKLLDSQNLERVTPGRTWNEYVEIGYKYAIFFFATALLLSLTAIFTPEPVDNMAYALLALVLGIASIYCWPIVWTGVVFTVIAKVC